MIKNIEMRMIVSVAHSWDDNNIFEVLISWISRFPLMRMKICYKMKLGPKLVIKFYFELLKQNNIK